MSRDRCPLSCGITHHALRHLCLGVSFFLFESNRSWSARLPFFCILSDAHVKPHESGSARLYCRVSQPGFDLREELKRFAKQLETDVAIPSLSGASVGFELKALFLDWCYLLKVGATRRE